MPAPLSTCAVLLEATERVRVGPLVLNNDLRHPVVLAREAAALAEFSGGRFELGLGAGHIAREYARAGIRFERHERRIDRLDEATQILKTLVAGETATYEGAHYTVRDEQIRPAPEHAVPVLIGGNSALLQGVSARHGDIVGLTGFGQRNGGAAPADLSTFGSSAAAGQIATIRRCAAEHGRSPRLQALAQWAQVTPNRRWAAESVATELGVLPEVALDSPYVLLGTVQEILDQIRQHKERLGIERWTVFSRHSGGQRRACKRSHRWRRRSRQADHAKARPARSKISGTLSSHATAMTWQPATPSVSRRRWMTSTQIFLPSSPSSDACSIR